jgi:hypothetical protein
MIRFLGMDVLLLRAFASAGMCLPSRCFTMGMHVTVCIKINLNCSLIYILIHLHNN